MSLRNSIICLVALVGLSACGFQPVYGHKPGEASGAGVIVDTLSGRSRMHQQFKADLEDKLNPAGKVPAGAEYRLNATLMSSAGAIGVARDGTVSRYNVYLDSQYELIRMSDGEKVTSGTLRHVSSYNNPTSQYFSTYMSEQDAIKRGVTELSELFKQRLSPFLVR